MYCIVGRGHWVSLMGWVLAKVELLYLSRLPESVRCVQVADLPRYLTLPELLVARERGEPTTPYLPQPTVQPSAALCQRLSPLEDFSRL